MDNHFEVFDLRVSKWGRTGRHLIFFEHFLRMAERNGWMTAVCAAGFGISCFYAYALLRTFLPAGYFAAVASFLAASLFFVAACRVFADRYFRMYRTEYAVCIRDAALQLTASLLAAGVFLPLGGAVPFVAFMLSYAALTVLYAAVFSKRKLPDMKIVTKLEADDTLDRSAVKDASSHEFRKVQIAGEVRNCAVLRKGRPMEVAAAGIRKLRLGIGAKESRPVASKLRVEGIYPSGGPVTLFKKEFNPAASFRDRVWNDVLVELPERDGNSPETLSLVMESDADPALYLSFPIAAREKEEKKGNIYILVVDSLRSDYMGTAGDNRKRGYRHVADFLEDSIVYPNAYTQGAWTLPTLASLFSGLYASYHDQHHPRLQKKMREDIPLLPEILRKEGYDTYGFGSGPRTTPNYGYSRGFDRYYYKICEKELGAATVDTAFSWAREQDRKSGHKRGQFYYLHLLEAHWPYYPPRDFEWTYNRVSEGDVLRDVKKYRGVSGALELNEDEMRLFKDLYRAEIDYCMYEIDRFLAYLKDTGVYEDSTVVIMGDHGCNFGEHREIATFDIYREYVNVALSVKYPGKEGKGGIDRSPVNANIDIAPTITALLGIGDKFFFNGRDLLNGQSRVFPEPVGEAAVSEDLYVNRYYVSIRNRDYSFIYRTRFDATTFMNFDREQEKFELYDLRKDPGESRNIFGDASPEIREGFVGALNEHIAGALSYHGVENNITIGA